mmetsp:Transcript_28985/g.43735  ORF Transcript_28985/g.43735 Transcript_28985/m.43735 type:complete len:318 (+) Transcript_28985:276-1229(+)
MSGEKVQGTVKWFSNKKGYGFVKPVEGSPVEADDIFVHQSAIHSDGYRTLDQGWTVEFTIGHDDSGKIKAENVTGVGGGPCTGPRSNPRRRKERKEKAEGGGTTGGGENNDAAESKEESEDHKEETPKNGGSKENGASSKNKKRTGRGRPGGGSGGGGGRGSGGDRGNKAPQSHWHSVLSSDVKAALGGKVISTNTGTIDISVGTARVKLGTRGYASMATADARLAEGSFTCGEDGQAVFTWKRCIIFDMGAAEWKLIDESSTDLLSSLSLADDGVTAVGSDETAATLWGDGPTDPKTALESNGFEMRRVVLTPKKR